MQKSLTLDFVETESLGLFLYYFFHAIAMEQGWSEKEYEQLMSKLSHLPFRVFMKQLMSFIETDSTVIIVLPPNIYPQ